MSHLCKNQDESDSRCCSRRCMRHLVICVCRDTAWSENYLGEMKRAWLEWTTVWLKRTGINVRHTSAQRWCGGGGEAPWEVAWGVFRRVYLHTFQPSVQQVRARRSHLPDADSIASSRKDQVTLPLTSGDFPVGSPRTAAPALASPIHLQTPHESALGRQGSRLPAAVSGRHAADLRSR